MSNLALQQQLTTETARSNYLAKVVSVNDPENQSRLKIRLLSFDGVDSQDAEIWA